MPVYRLRSEQLASTSLGVLAEEVRRQRRLTSPEVTSLVLGSCLLRLVEHPGAGLGYLAPRSEVSFSLSYTLVVRVAAGTSVALVVPAAQGRTDQVEVAAGVVLLVVLADAVAMVSSR